MTQVAVWTGNELPPANLAMLALAAPYTSFTSVPADQLGNHDHRLHTDDQCPYAQGASKWWGINNRDDTREVLGRLLAGMHSTYYLKVMQDQPVPEFWTSVINGPDAALLPHPMPRSIMAWDIARMANLTRTGYSLGRLSAEEAWSYLEAGLLRARGEHLDWLDYGHGFLLGRAFWLAANGDRASIAGSFAEWGNTIRRLHSDPGSQWLHTRL